MLTALAVAIATAIHCPCLGSHPAITAIAVTVAPAHAPEIPTGSTTAVIAITRAATISMGMDLGMAGIMEEREVVEEVVVVVEVAVVEAIVAGVEAVVAVKNS